MSETLVGFRFDNHFTRSLPADPVLENYRREVNYAFYSRVEPTRVSAPQLIAYSQDLARDLGITEEFINTPEFTAAMSGSLILEGMDPHATVYGGHQFGNWAGQLGDGRAINLGEILDPEHMRWMLQLKGSGPTPYSRTADGLAVMRSSLREYVCSEAMYYLGVPTTRALTLVATGENVLRDMFYDGHPAHEPGAVVCRVAKSFLRFGHFELPASREDIPLLRQLTNFTIRSYFAHLISADYQDPELDLPPEIILAFYQEVVDSTADLINHWMRVGFVHGVMNTDNLSILGLTIDYGPYGWMETYDEFWTPNTTDANQRRYRFGQQPRIALWNLAQLGSHLYPLINDATLLQSVLDSYVTRYAALENERIHAKLGLIPNSDENSSLFNDLTDMLTANAFDMTMFYRLLADLPLADAVLDLEAAELLLKPAQYTEELVSDPSEKLRQWLRAYHQRIAQDVVVHGVTNASRRASMNSVNPKYIFRNYMAQMAIDALETGDDSMLKNILDVIKAPYDEQPEYSDFFAKRPAWAANKAGCSMLSCSS